MFDIIIGNPPYEDEHKELGDYPLYHKFDHRYLSFIIPSRWMIFSKEGKLHKFCERMKQDKSFKTMVNFHNSSKVFPSDKWGYTWGGVNYFLRDKEYNGSCNINGIEQDLNVFIDSITKIKTLWSNQIVPQKYVRDMIGLIPNIKEMKRILVLFSFEFVPELIYTFKVKPENIIFVGDKHLEDAVFEKIHGCYIPKISCITNGIIDISKFLKHLEKEIGMTIATDTFDVVIGNPPYQEEDGGYGASAKPLYHKFIEMAIDKISPQYLSFIIPSRWMAGGKGLDAFRARMKKDKRLKIIRRFYDKIFENVEIKGGVCYFLWDKNYSGLCSFNNEKRDLDKFDIIVRDNISEKILEKVILKNFPSLGEKVSSLKPFGLSTNFQDWDKNGLICYARKRSKHYITKEKIPRINNSFGFWKVLAAKASGDSFLNATHNKGFRNIFIAEPNEVSTDTYIVLNWFGTKNEAENFYKYTQTKFFQALLSTRVISQHITKEKFSFIPDLKDYTKVWTDKELYEMFDLTEEEIDHIEISIKE